MALVRTGAVLISLVPVVPVLAATFNVNSTVDAVDFTIDGTCETAPGNGVCSLRAAIQEANAQVGPDTISVPAGTYVLTIAGTGEDAALTGDLDVTDAVSLSGAGASVVIIDGNSSDRVLHLLADTTLSGLTVQGGDVGTVEDGGGVLVDAVANLTDVSIKSNTGRDGAGIHVLGGSLTLLRATVSNNTSNGDGGGLATLLGATVTDSTFDGNSANAGGGIFSELVLTVSGTTFTGNSAADGGGIATPGVGPLVNLTNVTFSGNTATVKGGGVYLDQGTLVNTTFTANNATSGSGIKKRGGQVFAITNSIVANNLGSPDCSGIITSNGYNLDSGDSCSFNGPGDQINTDPLLGPLQDNGGLTETHELLPGSTALDAVLAGCPPPAVDQRGFPRPVDGDGDAIARCDAGAVEGLTFAISGTVYHDTNANSAFDAGELGIGDAWVKLVQGGSVLQVVEADPDTGAYELNGLLDGTYDVIVDDNDDVADSTPTAPVNWIFQNPASGLLSVTVSGADATDQNLGLTFNFDLGADCICGYEDGLFTQAPITIDGDMSDWAIVFSDGDNNACDDVDATDRDHPVQSTGRNLLRTAVTWDGTYFSMWTQRVGSSNNTQSFIYYADTNVDGIQSAGEPVVVARWQGSNGNVSLDLYAYDDLGSGGDSVLDPDGWADGYSLPGDLTFVKTLSLPAGAGQGSTSGSTSGTQMEWKIAWAELGLSPGAAIGWHVGSTNANAGSAGLGAQIDDNLGGCGGQCTGSNQFGGVSGNSNGSKPGQIIYSSYTFTNTGNGNDLFDFTWAWSGDFAPVSVNLYKDLGTIGEFDPADVLLTDTDGDTDPDTGVMAGGESFDLLVAIESPGPPANGTTTVAVTVTSNFVPGCGGTVAPPSTTVEDVIQLDPLALVKRAFQLDGTPIADGSTVPPSLSVRFLIYVNNPGGLTVADISVQDVLDPLFAYVPESMRFDASVDACADDPCTAAEEDAILAAAVAGTAGTDAQDGDVVSLAGTTLHAGNQTVANAQLDLPPGKVWALVFTLVMQ